MEREQRGLPCKRHRSRELSSRIRDASQMGTRKDLRPRCDYKYVRTPQHLQGTLRLLLSLPAATDREPLTNRQASTLRTATAVILELSGINARVGKWTDRGPVSLTFTSRKHEMLPRANLSVAAVVAACSKAE
jgi:hypothetical protein